MANSKKTKELIVKVTDKRGKAIPQCQVGEFCLSSDEKYYETRITTTDDEGILRLKAGHQRLLVFAHPSHLSKEMAVLNYPSEINVELSQKPNSGSLLLPLRSDTASISNILGLKGELHVISSRRNRYYLINGEGVVLEDDDKSISDAEKRLTLSDASGSKFELVVAEAKSLGLDDHSLLSAIRAVNYTRIVDDDDFGARDLDTIQIATPLAEEVRWMDETRRIRVTPIPMSNLGLWDVIKEKLYSAIADMREKAEGNAHFAMKNVLKNLQRVMDRYSDNPQQIHDEIELALGETRELMRSGEIADDNATKRFIRILDDCSLDIRGSVREVQEVIEKRAAMRFARLPKNEQEIIANITKEIVPYIEKASVARNMEDDTKALATNPKSEKQIARRDQQIYRLVSRQSRMVKPVWERIPKDVKKTGKKITIGVVVQSIVDVIGGF